MTRVVPKSQPGPAAATTAFGSGKRCTRVGCNGALEPSSDRNGASINECTKCGQIYRPGIAASASGQPCKVKGCPGHVDGSGACSCCARRQAFLEKNLPKRICAICTGEITGKGGRKHCEACRPVAQKVAVAKHKVAAA